MTRAVDCVELFRVHRTAEGDAAALQGLTLHVDPGELVACLGPSGSGKSTLLRVLAGLEPASAGRAAVLGHELGRLRARRRAVLRRALLGFVDQHPEQALPPDLPVAEGIALGLGLRGVSARSARARVAELLERVGLDGHGGTRPSELSGGELQRAAVCAAIAHRPPLVLADEPTGELDASTAAAVLELLVGLAREDGAAILLVTHDPAAAALADRTLAVRDGRLSDERRNDVHAAVVARGGWLRVPEAVLARAGITDRALVELSGAGVLLRPPDPAVARSAEGPHAPRAAPSSGASAAVTATVEAVTRRYGERVVLPPTTADFARP
jgi:ABC-type lipoprotein export system ATPase subunit